MDGEVDNNWHMQQITIDSEYSSSPFKVGFSSVVWKKKVQVIVVTSVSFASAMWSSLYHKILILAITFCFCEQNKSILTPSIC